MRIKEIIAKTVLTKTGIGRYDFCINPYVGCGHGCTYCYASFMKRFTAHKEPWGEFVDVKVNAAEVLARQLKRTKRGSVIVGTVTDPYQPAERRYRITRGCLEALKDAAFSVSLLTRSPLCLADVDIFKEFGDLEIGMTIPTDNEEIRRLFEPSAPPIPSRLGALKRLHAAGLRTHAFIGPMLPMDPGRLVGELSGAVDEVLIDRMNYSGKVKSIYRKAGLTRCLDDEYFTDTASLLSQAFASAGVSVSVLFRHL
jgi:DNA repair photolyase